ncbi:serine/threonine-protein phosphatase 6 regulatory ankyrin repeat subunit B-like isoform X1 [Pecten maximus]|uniref:serine/threonine-protein phosphatase 6 regulatory ankyrin repeat subunit B-like isoform X1 n=2 Tax=Pecten maximus TaxID=6579 RepID=UPI001457F348|nr:serine/threonine-protein phosphatase 6 regulatory ankyrin repeat subunit B-like isoform X1 [Pecten maximus]
MEGGGGVAVSYRYSSAKRRQSEASSHKTAETEVKSQTCPASPNSTQMLHRRPIKTALHQAVIDCRLHQVRLLVSKHGVNVDSKDLNGRTPMMLACIIEEEFGYRMAKILLKAGAFLNLRDNLGRTALSYACMNGREDIVRMIIREDVLDINEADNDGNTPLHHGASSGNPNIVTQLVDCFVRFGLDVDTRNSMGYTALLLACKNGHFVSAHVLIKKGGANPSLRDNEVFLNASDWSQRSHNVQSKFATRRVAPMTPSPMTFSFSRESTMYQRSTTPSCHHVKGQPDLFATWSDNGLRLPAVFSPNAPALERSETFIDGKDARQIVLNEIDDYETQNRPSSFKRSRVRNHPPTAKLMALSRRSKTTVIPDMTTIFRIYSDQYQPDWRKRSSFSRNSNSQFSICSSRTNSELPVEAN